MLGKDWTEQVEFCDMCVYVCVFGGHPNRTLLEFQCQQFGNVIPFDLLLVMRPSNSVVLTDKISRLKGFVCVGGGRGC